MYLFYTALKTGSKVVVFCFFDMAVEVFFLLSLLFFFNSDGAREMPLSEEFFTGFAKTALRPDEILLAIDIPHSKPVSYLKCLIMQSFRLLSIQFWLERHFYKAQHNRSTFTTAEL